MSEEMHGLRICDGIVKPEWIDYNGHMNVAYYVLAFDLAIDVLWARIGITPEYIRDTRGSTFAVECHVSYQRELRESEPYFVTMDLVAYDAKRIHQFQRMYHAEQQYLAATAEWMSLHVDLESRKVTQWPAPTLDELAAIAAAQAETGRAEEVGRRMVVREPIYEMS